MLYLFDICVLVWMYVNAFVFCCYNLWFVELNCTLGDKSSKKIGAKFISPIELRK